MGRSVIGVISNTLSSEEIINLPEKLNRDKPLGINEESWCWEMEDISINFLEEYWARDEDWHVNELANKRYDRIYKYPSIESSSLSILFFERNLMCISLPVKYFPTFFENSGIDIANSAIKLAKYFEQNTMVLTYDLGSGNTEYNKMVGDFGSLSNMVEAFKRTNRDFLRIEF